MKCVDELKKIKNKEQFILFLNELLFSKEEFESTSTEDFLEQLISYLEDVDLNDFNISPSNDAWCVLSLLIQAGLFYE